MIQYDDYRFSPGELVMYTGQWLCLCGILGWVFYHSVIAAAVLALCTPLFLKDKKKELIKKRKQKLNSQFKDGITGIASALLAGYSVENAVRQSYEELLLLYEPKALIVQEFHYIIRHLEMNETIESLLMDLAQRSKDEDIKSFAEVFVTAKRSGGDFIGIIDMTSRNISGKIEVKREIQVILSSRQLEQRIMNVIPIAIVLYVGSTSPGFFDALYGNAFGIIAMSICLLVYGGAYMLGRKIVNIEV